MQSQFLALSDGSVGISQSQLLKLLAGMQDTLPGILADLETQGPFEVDPDSAALDNPHASSSSSNNNNNNNSALTHVGNGRNRKHSRGLSNNRRRRRSSRQSHTTPWSLADFPETDEDEEEDDAYRYKYGDGDNQREDAEHGRRNVASDVIAGRLFQMLNQNASGLVQFQVRSLLRHIHSGVC